MLAAVKEARAYWNSRREKDFIREDVRAPELCRQKLLHYAESFQELARSLGTDAEKETDDGPARSMDRREALEKKRAQENKMLISYNLGEMAQIMNRLADELFCFRPLEERYRKTLLHALRAESIYADHFCYLTDKTDDTHAISMTLCTDIRGGRQASQVADMLSVLLNRPLQLSAASPYLVEKEPHSYVFMEEAKYVALTGFCKVTKENEKMSGDHYSILESEKGRMTLILSDGTGSGENASRDSEKALDLMEKLLEAGYDTDAAINMVNVAFFAGEREYRHPTLDVCDLDLYSGECRFHKVGAAVSFVKSGGRTERIGYGSLPLGIFRNVENAVIHRQLQDGDYVILVTDGILDALGEDCEQVMEENLSEMPESGPGEIAEKLLEIALCRCGGHVRDDMTVLVAGIWENTAV